MILPLGAHSVAGVEIDIRMPDEVSLFPVPSTDFIRSESSTIGDAIRA